jgi:hypothetical protein
MTTLLALDPGGTPTAAKSRSATGWSLWTYDAVTPLRPVTHGQVPGNQSVFKRWWLDEAQHLGADEVVCESFVLDGRTQFPDTTPLKIEGVLEALTDLPIAFQRNGMKAHLRDEKIESLGLWWPGQGHAMDSMRHAFAYVKVRGHMPSIRAYWPDLQPV